MKKLLAALMVGALVMGGGYAHAAWDPEVSVAPFYRISDNESLENGVGIAAELQQDVGNGITVGLELQTVNQDVEASGFELGELQTTGIFGNVKYDVLTHEKIKIRVVGGIGFLAFDADSSIDGISAKVDSTGALKAAIEWAWNVHTGSQAVDASYWESIDVEVFGQLGYMLADADLKLTADGSRTFVASDQDVDGGDIKAGVNILF